MKITIYELLGMVKDEPDRSIHVKYFDRVNKKDDVMWACKENIIYKLEQLIIELNDTVEILEEEKKIPEKIKIDNEDRIQALSTGNFVYKVNQPTKNIIYKINEIIDTLEILNDKIK